MKGSSAAGCKDIIVEFEEDVCFVDAEQEEGVDLMVEEELLVEEVGDFGGVGVGSGLAVGCEFIVFVLEIFF